MPAISHRGLDRFEFLSDDLRGAIRRRIGELCGLSLLLLSLLLTLALVSWSVQDPSLSHATDAPVRNWLGRSAPPPSGRRPPALVGQYGLRMGPREPYGRQQAENQSGADGHTGRHDQRESVDVHL